MTKKKLQILTDYIQHDTTNMRFHTIFQYIMLHTSSKMESIKSSTTTRLFQIYVGPHYKRLYEIQMSNI